MEEIDTGSLRQITGKQARRLGYWMWETPKAEGVRETAGTQSDMTYIGRRQETVAQWVVLPPLFEVCAREKGYKGVHNTENHAHYHRGYSVVVFSIHQQKYVH